MASVHKNAAITIAGMVNDIRDADSAAREAAAAPFRRTGRRKPARPAPFGDTNRQMFSTWCLAWAPGVTRGPKAARSGWRRCCAQSALLQTA